MTVRHVIARSASDVAIPAGQTLASLAMTDTHGTRLKPRTTRLRTDLDC